MKKLPTKIFAGLGICFVLFYLGFGIKILSVAPEHAIVLVDRSNKIYLSPPCVPNRMGRFTYEKMVLRDARNLDLKPSSECSNQDGFTQEVRSPSGLLLEKIGILNELESRWNSDGSWKW